MQPDYTRNYIDKMLNQDVFGSLIPYVMGSDNKSRRDNTYPLIKILALHNILGVHRDYFDTCIINNPHLDEEDKRRFKEIIYLPRRETSAQRLEQETSQIREEIRLLEDREAHQNFFQRWVYGRPLKQLDTLSQSVKQKSQELDHLRHEIASSRSALETVERLAHADDYIWQLFGGRDAYLQLPVVPEGRYDLSEIAASLYNDFHSCYKISLNFKDLLPSHLTAPIMRGVSKEGQEFFVLRFKGSDGGEHCLAFFQSVISPGTWEHSGPRPLRVPFKIPISTYVVEIGRPHPEIIESLKTLIQTRRYGDYELI